MKHADAIYDWSPSSRAHRELVSSKLPLEPMTVEKTTSPWFWIAIVTMIATGVLLAGWI